MDIFDIIEFDENGNPIITKKEKMNYDDFLKKYDYRDNQNYCDEYPTKKNIIELAEAGKCDCPMCQEERNKKNDRNKFYE